MGAPKIPKEEYLVLTLASDEELGKLDGHFLEDYNGISGQVTLRHSEGQEFIVEMAEVEGGGSPPSDHFQGTRAVADMPLGLYAIQGRCRDTVGNYTVLTDVANPYGDERIIPLEFAIFELLDNPRARIILSPPGASTGLTGRLAMVAAEGRGAALDIERGATVATGVARATASTAGARGQTATAGGRGRTISLARGGAVSGGGRGVLIEVEGRKN